MRQPVSFVHFKIISCAAFVLGISACISVPDSPSPRFYSLKAAGEYQPAQKFTIASDAIIGIGPVKIPGYLNRPQIVTRESNNMLNFAQFDRWGEPLDFALGRLVRDDLMAIFSGVTFEIFPWNMDIPVRYQVFIEVVQLECELKKDLYFAAQWSIVELDRKKMLVIKKSEFRQPISPGNYSGLAKAFSAACASLSGDIAEGIVSSVNRPQRKKDIPAVK